MIEKLDLIKHTDNLYDKNGFVANVACGGVVIRKLNEVIAAINNQQIQLNNHECRLLDLHSRITALEDPTYHEAEPEPAANVQDRMIGCTTLDIPESYIKSCRMDKEFVEEECARLQGKLDRTRKALGVAVDGLEKMTWGCDSSDAELLLKEIKEITALTKGDNNE